MRPSQPPLEADPHATIARLGPVAALDTRDADLHAGLAAALMEVGRFDAAAASAARALGINPALPGAQKTLQAARAKIRSLNEAIVRHKSAGTRQGNARILECLYALNHVPEYDKFLAMFAQADPTNVRAATISAFVAHQRGIANAYPFCRSPLDFVRAKNVAPALGDIEAFAAGLRREIAGLEDVWEPAGKTTTQGFQTAGNMFERTAPQIAKLEALLRAEIAAYVASHRGQADGYIAQWPKAYQLDGWYVRLVKSGHQRAHIHPGGWLSGVLYLRLPRRTGDEGAIRFTLRGEEYPVYNPDIPTRIHHPTSGELVMFPSSLFHETIPFAADEERHSVAFDVVPAA